MTVQNYPLAMLPAEQQRLVRQEAERAAKLGGPNEVMIFFREGHFYPVQGVLGREMRQQAQDHAALNPGTLRVEDINGNVLWQMQ